MYNGIINVYKEAGFTSHDVVAKLRGILKQKKIGHTGTLDPDAVGVLPVCLGSGTRLCDMLTGKSKEYCVEFLFGRVTDTQDISGEIIAEWDVHITREQAEQAIQSFVGEYAQIPPMYSAIKIDGKRLYQLARQGKEIERKARNIVIDYIQIEKIELPLVKMTVGCSKGTYIRTLCHDIGQKLGCGAVMTSLERTRSGDFYKEKALTLAQIEELRDEGMLSSYIIPVEAVFKEYPKVVVKAQFRRLIDNGNSFYSHMTADNIPFEDGKQVRVYNDGEKFCGIFEYCVQEDRFKPIKMFVEK